MKEWIDGICDRVDQLTAQQPYYQELLAQFRKLEPLYREVLASLPAEDAEVISDFFYLTTEMEYQKTQTAYNYGRRWGNTE